MLLHLHNSHTFQEVVGIQYQMQDQNQGKDYIFLEVASQMKWLMLKWIQGMLQ